MNEIPGALLDALIDTAKLLPILFLTYLAMEAIEHYAGERTYAWIKKPAAQVLCSAGLWE